MTIVGRRAITSHTIGASGKLVVRTVRGSVRIRGVDGEDVRLEAHYSIRADSPDSGEVIADPESDGVLRIERLPGEMRIEVTETGSGILAALGRMMSGGEDGVDLDIQMPAGAKLVLSGVSADVDARDLDGEQSYRTISGDADIGEVRGNLKLQSVSGDVSVTGGVLSVEANTTSGDLSITAEHFEGVRVKSISGDVRLAGAFAEGVTHAVETVSGDLELEPVGGVTVWMSGISGSIHTNLSNHSRTVDGRRVMTIGEGAAVLEMRTMSGDTHVVARRVAPPPDPAGRVSAAQAETELDVLRALERGEIDVDEASRRLEGARRDA